ACGKQFEGLLKVRQGSNRIPLHAEQEEVGSHVDKTEATVICVPSPRREIYAHIKPPPSSPSRNAHPSRQSFLIVLPRQARFSPQPDEPARESSRQPTAREAHLAGASV